MRGLQVCTTTPCLYRARDYTQGLLNARQALYRISRILSFSKYFWWVNSCLISKPIAQVSNLLSREEAVWPHEQIYCSNKLVFRSFLMETVKLFIALQVYVPGQEFPRTNRKACCYRGPQLTALIVKLRNWNKLSLPNMESNAGNSSALSICSLEAGICGSQQSDTQVMVRLFQGHMPVFITRAGLKNIKFQLLPPSVQIYPLSEKQSCLPQRGNSAAD